MTVLLSILHFTAHWLSEMTFPKPNSWRARQRITALQLIQTCCWPAGAESFERNSRSGGALYLINSTWPTLCAALQNVLYILMTSYNSLIFEQITICLYNRVEVVFSTTIPCFFGGREHHEALPIFFHTRKSGGPNPEKVTQMWIGKCILAKSITSSHTVWINKNSKQMQLSSGLMV